jgi:hypothetical protein
MLHLFFRKFIPVLHGTTLKTYYNRKSNYSLLSLARLLINYRIVVLIIYICVDMEV